MNIFIITNYSAIPNKKNQGRFVYLANLLTIKGHQVTFFTSTFSHRLKKQREFELNKSNAKNNVRIILVYEQGYHGHFSLDRIVSIRAFGKNLEKELNKTEVSPDLIYFSFPTYTSAQKTINYAKKNNIPTIIDIQDLWPESLLILLQIPKAILKLLYFPFIVRRNNILSDVNAIVSVSKTFIKRTKNLKNDVTNLSVYIGVDLNKFDSCTFKYIKPKGEFWLIYVGTISFSYDIETIINAMEHLKSKPETRCIKLNILGVGPNIERLKKIATLNELPIHFTGFLKYEDMVNYLKNSDIALNSIVKKSQTSVTNKLGDYFAAGLPILNSCINTEVRNLITIDKTGLNYEAGNEIELASKVHKMFKDKKKLKIYAQNSRHVAEEKFDRKKTYPQIVKLIENVDVKKNFNIKQSR
ncbi:Glycosyltransferase involved in cell wall bisynthesis [Maribacter dokdonensis]|uniref:Glycosyltransferase involved in cell wall bisynthesis n=1 Tax=Maribacter dokdonensis TaxID=320912 RepID=A0A1H4QEB5_9FLAO|nr:glycosyltransferase family 4 protein [Maribacter dokdonensis]SEC17947.1 Glycosyltransferase involved in cell wall bisynthesis [Maribacter dokdonensis]